MWRDEPRDCGYASATLIMALLWTFSAQLKAMNKRQGERPGTDEAELPQDLCLDICCTCTKPTATNPPQLPSPDESDEVQITDFRTESATRSVATITEAGGQLWQRR